MRNALSTRLIGRFRKIAKSNY